MTDPTPAATARDALVELVVRGHDLHRPVLGRLDNGVEILVDGDGQHRAAVAFVIGGQVRAAAAETQAHRSLGNDHACLVWDVSAGET